jgi:hypothetical protein
MERQNADLWAKALKPGNQYRCNDINKVDSTALPELTKADEVPATVRPSSKQSVPTSSLSCRNLQNLFTLTAIKADRRGSWTTSTVLTAMTDRILRS